jgi:hypothetical protein
MGCHASVGGVSDVFNLAVFDSQEYFHRVPAGPGDLRVAVRLLHASVVSRIVPVIDDFL